MDKKRVTFSKHLVRYTFFESTDWQQYRYSDLNRIICDKIRFQDRVKKAELLIGPILKLRHLQISCQNGK